MDRVWNLVKDVYIETLEEIGGQIPANLDRELVLFGQGAFIDSLTLVSFIVNLEARCSESFGFEVCLTDDRAMTRDISPFSNLSSLCQYISEITAPGV